MAGFFTGVFTLPFRSVVERAKLRPKVYLPSEQIPIEDRIEQLMAKLSETDACGFEDLFSDVQSRAGIVVTFLAMLEMIRLKLIRVFQSGSMRPSRFSIPSNVTPRKLQRTMLPQPQTSSSRPIRNRRRPRRLVDPGVYRLKVLHHVRPSQADR